MGTTKTTGSRALALGGGGVSGIAWETGVLVGLAETGVLDLTTVDLFVGTSAGATVAAQITSGADMTTLLAVQLDSESVIEPKPHVEIKTVLGEIDRLLNSTPDPAEGRRLVGAFALNSDVPSTEQRLAVIWNRLPVHSWPEANLVITAVDAESGALVELTEDSGLSLVEAVAASCAIPGVWPPVNWEGRYLVDGGMRTVANEDLAAGYARVIVLQPFDQGPRPSDSASADPSSMFVIRPDAAYREAAPNALDPAARPVCAMLGREHAHRLAGDIKRFWSP
ncbi:patatin-like phospholipase family protein [Rhodococcus sp. Eu-32]|uniref:patatin-like phospholipase family protein n=1 Tax=Rhodococcus sp. Eu-32 TaxID=1017319 RepID=UPI000DF4459E|nr:patatin-like phospholipase family protein [Rhodococcus sp. Eu-32]RRQ24917.1 patatin-like phospholipase family protein [Rhodococcus sp. Eu-32]